MAQQAAWNEVPQELLHRPKTGFSIPTRDWIATDMKTKERGLRGWARLVYRQTQRCFPYRKWL
jgi:hypothetical protein